MSGNVYNPSPLQFGKSVDLRTMIRKFGLPVRNQGGRGTCSVFASTFLLEYMVCKTRGLEVQTSDDSQARAVNFSEEYLNAVANLARQKRGQLEVNPDGDTFQGCWWGYEDFGIVEEEWFPYQETFDPNKAPDPQLLEMGKTARFFKADIMLSTKPPTYDGASPKGLSEPQLNAVVSQLDQGKPVSFGVHLAEGMETVSYGGLLICNAYPDEKKGACGHSIAIVGYSANTLIPTGGYFIFRNSWGALWGDHGYGYLSYDFARNYVYDAAVYDVSPKFIPGIEMPKQPYKIALPPPPWHLADELGRIIHPASRLR
jgi:C1A family cysteine protease